jgi:hypothetical protein
MSVGAKRAAICCSFCVSGAALPCPRPSDANASAAAATIVAARKVTVIIA